MHSYSIDKKIRNMVTIGIFIISIVVAIILRTVLVKPLVAMNSWVNSTCMKSVIDFISITGFVPNILEVATIYGGLSVLYEKYIWKWSIVKKVHGIPNLNGEWEGKLKSSFNEKEIDMTMKITQTWSEISFVSTYPKSKSASNNAAIHLEANCGITIYFGFHNNSNDIEAGMQSYDGYNILILEDDNRISARYFNDRPNSNKKIRGGNKGTFELARKLKKE